VTPIRIDRAAIIKEVTSALTERLRIGEETYGSGDYRERSEGVIQDLEEELLDALVYLWVLKQKLRVVGFALGRLNQVVDPTPPDVEIAEMWCYRCRRLVHAKRMTGPDMVMSEQAKKRYKAWMCPHCNRQIVLSEHTPT
jgi:hypothetical protein